MKVASNLIHTAAAEGDVRSTWADLERAERGLGYRPRVSLEEGIREQVEWALEEEFASAPISGTPDSSEGAI